MWAIFKDDNDYNEKSIIGFAAFAVMTIFAVVDLATGIIEKIWSLMIWYTIHLYS